MGAARQRVTTSATTATYQNQVGILISLPPYGVLSAPVRARGSEQVCPTANVRAASGDMGETLTRSGNQVEV